MICFKPLRRLSMAKNDITRPRAHLKMCGYTLKHNKGWQYYKHPSHIRYVSYRCGTWNSSDKRLARILNKLTRRPKRHRNRKLTVCEAILRMAGGVKNKAFVHIWKINDTSIWYINSANHWTTNGHHIKGDLVNILNKEMITS